MMHIFNQWEGKFEVGGKLYHTAHEAHLDDLHDGDEFSVKLVPVIEKEEDDGQMREKG